MYEDRASRLLGGVNESKSLVEMLFDILRAVVCGVELLVGDVVGHGVGRLHGRHVQHVVNAEGREALGVGGVVHVAQEEKVRHLGGRVVLNIFGDGNIGGGGGRGQAGGGGSLARGPHEMVLAERGLGRLEREERFIFLLTVTGRARMAGGCGIKGL